MNFRVIGGKRLRRFIAASFAMAPGGGLPTPQRIRAAFIRLYPIGQLRSAVRSFSPGSSGRLSRSLRLVETSGGVELHGLFYGRFTPNRDRIEAEAMKLAETTKARMASYFRAGGS